MTRAGWLAAAAAVLAGLGAAVSWSDSSGGTAASPAGGATLFQAKGCTSCHAGPDSWPTIDSGFPSLIDVGSWAGTRREGMSARAYVTESIRSPGAFISPAWGGSGPTRMPDLGLSDAEIDALVDYLLQG